MPLNVPEVSAHMRAVDFRAAVSGEEPRPVFDLIWMPMR